MKVAILSDIHGNLIALEEVMKDIAEEAPDQVWCGGDLAWGGPWATECIERIRESGWVTVRGNTDVWITGDPQTLETPEDRRQLEEIARYHAIPKDDATWLLNLPLGHSAPGSVLLVHGTPQSPFRAPQPDAPAREFEPYLGAAGLVVYGHVHRPFVRRLSDGTLVANSGSVGVPGEGPDATYLLLTRDGPEWLLQHKRVPFDRAAVVAESRRKGGPLHERFLQHFGEE